MTYGFGYVDIARARALHIDNCTVFVNGVAQPDCFAFNDIEGWADCYARDRDGNIIVCHCDTYARRVFGKITLARKR